MAREGHVGQHAPPWWYCGRSTALDRAVNGYVFVSLFTAVFAVCMVVFGSVVLDATSLWTLNQGVWGPSVPEHSVSAWEWSHRTFGSFICPVALADAGLAHFAMRKRERWALYMGWCMLTTWYVPACMACIVYGYASAAWVNTAFCLMFAVPLLHISWHIDEPRMDASSNGSPEPELA